MRTISAWLFAALVLVTSAAGAAEGLTTKQVEGFYKQLAKLYSKGELRDVARLYTPDYEFVDPVSGSTPIRMNRVSYFREAVVSQARASRRKREYEIRSIEIAPDAASAEVVALQTNTQEEGGQVRTSRTLERSTLVASGEGPLMRRTELMESDSTGQKAVPFEFRSGKYAIELPAEWRLKPGRDPASANFRRADGATLVISVTPSGDDTLDTVTSVSLMTVRAAGFCGDGPKEEITVEGAGWLGKGHHCRAPGEPGGHSGEVVTLSVLDGGSLFGMVIYSPESRWPDGKDDYLSLMKRLRIVP